MGCYILDDSDMPKIPEKWKQRNYKLAFFWKMWLLVLESSLEKKVSLRLESIQKDIIYHCLSSEFTKTVCKHQLRSKLSSTTLKLSFWHKIYLALILYFKLKTTNILPSFHIQLWNKMLWILNGIPFTKNWNTSSQVKVKEI